MKLKHSVRITFTQMEFFEVSVVMVFHGYDISVVRESRPCHLKTVQEPSASLWKDRRELYKYHILIGQGPGPAYSDAMWSTCDFRLTGASVRLSTMVPVKRQDLEKDHG